ncbi:RNA helicase [Cronobacter sakazakii]|uniref:RNA helicase n=1 Tax=Cronobacter sakazakii TaxID=28141 RepID=UPI000CFBF055|nr:RNA helicase [Cronobacter sakazakii]PQX84112.1 RNA helicase [Cronobacter sakazakii]PQY01717.1 RNA helicase [Cronobacter sakazakii]PQY37150.1 RNA helicase [Cronobacter sakazakii]PQY56382.1 RNA helicase [Cronobacter sakazakii]
MKKSEQNNDSATEKPEDEKELPVCGIIMPIAKTDGYPDKHWADVYSILCEAASVAGFTPNLVSFDDDVGIIHKRIVQNIYSNPMVICDISSRNANVMLELGMRLAFDKPTIIVKDDKTPYSFDIAAIEHLEYPSDLRYQLINEFKEKLKIKIIETYKRSLNDKEFTTFLKHFGTFKVAKIDEEEVSGVEYLAAEIKELKQLMAGSINTVTKKNSASSGLLRQGSLQLSSHVKVPEKYLKSIDLLNLGKYLLTLGIHVIRCTRLESADGLRIVYQYDPDAEHIDIAKAVNNYIEFSLEP